ncbi:MAG: hypothetical protein AB1847_08830 [bacterium]
MIRELVDIIFIALCAGSPAWVFHLIELQSPCPPFFNGSHRSPITAATTLPLVKRLGRFLK